MNSTKRGFSIGACGLVGFLAVNNVTKINKDKTVIVYIESMNINQGIISFSQKNIHKKAHKTLLKLASRIVFVFDSNSKKNLGLQGGYSSVVRALNCDFKSREFKSHYSPFSE